jgi:alpha-glucosidase
MMRTDCRALAVVAAGVLALVAPPALAAPPASRPFVVTSPNGHVRIEVSEAGGAGPRAGVVYSVRLGGRVVIADSRLGLVTEDGPLALSIVAHHRSRRNTHWTPLYGERSRIPDRFEALTLELATPAPRERRLAIEFRAYDEGMAFRYAFAKDGAPAAIRAESSEFRLPPGAAAWPIYGAEETFPTDPVPIDRLRTGAHVPLTVRTNAGFASILEAHVVDYPRMRLDPTGDDALVTALLGPAVVTPPSATPWRVILLGKDEGRLIEHAHIVLSLNPPNAIADSSWIRPGKTISNEGSVPLETGALERVIDFAAATGFKYLQLDWGWYGTEWAWSDAERATFRKTMPAYADRTDWVTNTFADPYRVARGPVPYRPDWKSVTDVDLDLPALIKYGRDRDVGLGLYVEAEHTLGGADLDRLFAAYRQWGVAGLKPGFVPVGTQEDTRWIRALVETAARHHLWLCVHDAHVPDGMERTWPNLFISEGGGGQEGNHPASHDVTLPFTRNLAGAFDYTPRLYTAGKTHAHMLAFLVVYYGPAQTIRGGYPAWHGDSSFGRGGDEIEFLRRVPVSWDETRVLDARIGGRIVMARRSGDTWFLGGMSGADAERLDVGLGFLSAGRAYTARIFADGPLASDGAWCPTRLETKTVGAADRLGVAMQKAGGFVAILDPVGPRR